MVGARGIDGAIDGARSMGRDRWGAIDGAIEIASIETFVSATPD